MLAFVRSHPRVARAFLTVSISLAACTLALAQQPGAPPDQATQGSEQGRGPNVDRQLEHLTQALSLTDTQQAQIRTILTDQKAQMDALMQQGGGQPGASGDRSDMRRQMRALRQSTHDKIAAVLDDTQKQKFEAMPQRRHGRGNGQGEGSPQGGDPGPQGAA